MNGAMLIAGVVVEEAPTVRVSALWCWVLGGVGIVKRCGEKVRR